MYPTQNQILRRLSYFNSCRSISKKVFWLRILSYHLNQIPTNIVNPGWRLSTLSPITVVRLHHFRTVCLLRLFTLCFVCHDPAGTTDAIREIDIINNFWFSFNVCLSSCLLLLIFWKPRLFCKSTWTTPNSSWTKPLITVCLKFADYFLIYFYTPRHLSCFSFCNIDAKDNRE